MTITEFIAARLDADERAAKAVMNACRDTRAPWPPQQAAGYGGPALTAFMRRFSEDRAVREVAAKRAILIAHQGAHDCPSVTREHHPVHGDWDYISCEYIEVGESCSTLRYLAVIWAEHPDYEEGWRPEP